jgi:hypothetical protein
MREYSNSRSNSVDNEDVMDDEENLAMKVKKAKRLSLWTTNIPELSNFSEA